MPKHKIRHETKISSERSIGGSRGRERETERNKGGRGPEDEPRGRGGRETAAGEELLAASRLAAAAASASAAAFFRGADFEGEIERAPGMNSV